MKIKFSALILLTFFVMGCIIVPPCLGATVGGLEYYSGEWQGKDWLLSDMYTSVSGDMEPVSYVNDNGNLVVRSLDGINTRVTAKYPDSQKENGTPNDYDPEDILKFMDDKEFDVHFRMRFEGQINFMIRCHHTAVRLWFRDDGSIRYDDGASNYHGTHLQTGGEWHDFTVKVRGQNCSSITPRHCLAHVRLYMDGKEVLSFCTEKYYPAAYRSVSFYADYNYSFSSMAEIAYCEIENHHTSNQILTPTPNKEFSTNEDVILTVNAGATGNETKNVDFYLGNTLVASGTDTASSNATANIGTLNPGTYVFRAVSDNVSSADITFSVKDDKLPKIDLNQRALYGEALDVKFSNADYFDVQKVEYYVDGSLKATATEGTFYNGVLTDIPIGSHSVWAKVYCTDGKIYETPIRQLDVDSNSFENLDFNCEYQADYTTSGDGNLLVYDGIFSLSLRHCTEGLFYVDHSGTEKNYGTSVGDGSYRVVVTSGNAEVYYNGQFLFSFLMPLCDAEKSISSNSLSNLTIKSSGVKATILNCKTNSDGSVSKLLPDFGMYYSLEFEKKDSQSKNILLYDGSFEAAINMTDDGIYANYQPTNGALTQKLKLSDENKAGFYRITVGHGMAQLFCNNTIVGTFRCPLKAHRPSVFIDGKTPDENVFLKYADDVYYHFEDFQGNGEDGFCAEDYWHAESDSLADSAPPEFSHQIIVENGNSFLSVGGKGDYLLNAISDEVSFKWKGLIKPGAGEFRIIFSHHDICDYQSLIYDIGTQTWRLVKATKKSVEILDTEDSDNDGDTTEVLKTCYVPDEATVLTKTHAIDEHWHNFELKTDRSSITLLCDGETIISADEGCWGYGRLGFGTRNAEVLIDDVDYIGCGKANAGLSFLTDVGHDFYENFNSEILMVANYGNTKYHKSQDNGKTWSLVEYDGTKSIGTRSSNNLKLLSGKFLRTMMSGKYTYAYLYDSQTNPDTENTLGSNPTRVRIEPEGKFDTVPYSCMPSRLMQVQSGPYKGRVFFCRGGSDETQGKTFMYYTDDYADPDFYGKATWHEPNIQPSYLNTGINVQESQMVDMPDGSVRYYMRTNRGAMHYIESYDGGETLDVTNLKIENLISPLCCYSIQRVGNTSTYYAFWEYDTTTASQTWIGTPRLRRSLAVSHDGMKTWQYVADIEEDIYSGSLKSACNHGMRVVNGAVYMSYYCSPNLHKMYRQDISKIKPLMRFTSLHFREVDYLRTNDFIDEHCAIPKTSGEAYVYGEYTSSSVNEKGYIDEKTFAACAGAELFETENGIDLTLGETTVSFCDSLETYLVNGEEKSCEKAYYENGFVNPLAMAEIFGKHIHFTDFSIVVSPYPLGEALLFAVDGKARSEMADDAFKQAFVEDVNEASKTDSPEAIEFAYNAHMSSLGNDFPVLSNQNALSLMTGTEYFCADDVSKAYKKALNNNVGANLSDYVFTTSMGNFDNFSNLGFGEIETENEVLYLKSEKGIERQTKYRFFGDIPEKHAVSFDFMPDKTDGEFKVEFGNGSYSGIAFVDKYSLTLKSDQYLKRDISFEDDKWYRLTLSIDHAGYLEVKIEDIALGEILLIESMFLCPGSFEGLSFESNCINECNAKLKNIRIFNNAFLDVVSQSASNGEAFGECELVAGFSNINCANVIMAIYDGDKLLGVGMSKNDSSYVEALRSKSIEILPFSYGADTQSDVEIKFFSWSELSRLRPLTKPAEVK